MFTPISLKIHLQHLICHDKGKSKKTCNPYMWCAFFKIDGSTVHISNNFTLKGTGQFQFSKGSHGNLHLMGVENNTTVTIPQSIGHWETLFTPLQLPYFKTSFPAMMGIIVVLLKQGSVSYTGVEAGHQALNNFIQHDVNKAIENFDPQHIDIYHIEKAMRHYFRTELDKAVVGMDSKIMQAIVKGQSVFQNLWSIVQRDQLIGHHIWDFNHFDFKSLLPKQSLPLQHRLNQNPTLGDWEIKGHISRI